MMKYSDRPNAYINAKDLEIAIVKATSYGDALNAVREAPSIDIVRCGECKHWDDRRDDDWWSEDGACYKDSILGHAIYRTADDFCSYGSRSEKPNNCEHITEDGVTCAKYPACDDCLDNPLNKVKGSERLVKGSERSSE